MKKTYLYLVELIRAALHHRQAEEKPEDVTWEALFRLAQEHMVVSLAFESIKKLQNKPETQLYGIWNELSDKALVKELSFQAERSILLGIFEEKGIRYLPLKGILMQTLYERPGLRQFSDNDILFESGKEKEVESIMHSLGYEGKAGEGNHDEYQKPPIYNFELHKELLPRENPLSFYFGNIWERALKDEGNQMGYHMSEEDFYLFHIVHLEKHFGGSGTGLRYFADQFYLMDQIEQRRDRSQLEQKLQEIGMLEFEQKINELTKQLFQSDTGDWEHAIGEDLEEMFLYIMSCGAYGTMEHLIENRMKKSGGKCKYFVSRLTCEDVYMKKNYPILKKASWLKPVFVVWRLISAPFQKTDIVKAELQSIFGSKHKNCAK